MEGVKSTHQLVAWQQGVGVLDHLLTEKFSVRCLAGGGGAFDELISLLPG